VYSSFHWNERLPNRFKRTGQDGWENPSLFVNPKPFLSTDESGHIVASEHYFSLICPEKWGMGISCRDPAVRSSAEEISHFAVPPLIETISKLGFTLLIEIENQAFSTF
jgi:hypothetical protein